jgi:hypothetical protein
MLNDDALPQQQLLTTSLPHSRVILLPQQHSPAKRASIVAARTQGQHCQCCYRPLLLPRLLLLLLLHEP